MGATDSFQRRAVGVVRPPLCLALTLSLRGCSHCYVRAVLEPVKSGCGQGDASVQALHSGVLLIGRQRGHILDSNGIVGSDDVYEIISPVVLDRHGGYEGDALQRPYEQSRVDELVWK